MKVLYIHKALYDRRPPIISTVERLIQLNHQVKLVTSGINSETKTFLQKKGIDIYDVGEMPISKFGKLLYYIKYRRFTKKIIKECSKDHIIWIGSVDAAIAIGKHLLQFPYILQIQELYDKNKFLLKKLKKYIISSKVNIVPDNARALIFRSWYKLKTTPVLLPNKPFLTNLHKNQIIPNSNNAKKLEKIKNKKLVLYQAVMIRMDTSDIAQALLELGDDYVLGLFGGIRDKNLVDKMLGQYPNVLHFEHMYAPNHLTLTSCAHIGVLTYNYESLNNVFCAPNKIWEFSGFGIPMLANNLPVVKLQFEKYNAGECYEFGDIELIKSAILKISNNYYEYSEGAKNLYDSVDMGSYISNILNKMNNNEDPIGCN